MKLATVLCMAGVVAAASSAAAQTTLRTIPNVSAWSMDVGADFDGDGYVDVIAGNPFDGTNGSNCGTVKIVSGKHIATGNGAAVLATYAHTVASEELGYSVAWLTGQLFVAGAPGGSTSPGAVYLCQVDSSGSSITAVDAKIGSAASERLGISVAALGSWDAPGFPSVAAGGPGTTSGTSLAMVKVFRLSLVAFPVHHFALSGPTFTITDGFLGSRFGQSVAAADFGNVLGNGASKELVVGAPNAPSPFPPYLSTAGTVRVFAVAPGSGVATPVATIAGDANNKHIGISLDAGGDVDGDGVADVVTGSGDLSSGWGNNEGLVILAGGGIVGGLGLGFIRRIPSEESGSAFEMCPRIVPDVNSDGRADVMAGAPHYSNITLYGGTAYVFSGETAQRLMRHPAPAGYGQQAGIGVEAYPGGLLLVGSSEFSNSELLYVVSIYPIGPQTYCTGKLNSIGCPPFVGSVGSPDVNSAAPFDVKCINLLNQKNGFLFYGFAQVATPFQGGWLCVAPPTQRTLIQSSGGSASGNDCTGEFHYDFNARIQSGVDPALNAGQEVFAQYWSRDPASPSTTSLSNALWFVVNP
jgi:hypothetical protein